MESGPEYTLMPRRKVHRGAVDGRVPAVLLNPDAAVWQTAAATAAWLRKGGLQAGWWIQIGPAVRHAHAVELWAAKHGVTRAFGAERRQFVDWGALKALGVPGRTSAPLLERLAAIVDEEALS